MRRYLFLLALLAATGSFAQTARNESLRRELDSIYRTDQYYRALMGAKGAPADSLARVYQTTTEQLDFALWQRQSRIDSANLQRIEAIIARYGYPGRTLVDSPANEAAFYVIQHSPKIDTYLPLLKAAADKNELPFRLYAMMLDRSLMYAGKEQEWGTQGHGFEYLDSSSGKKAFRMIVWPVRDPASINERRRKAGFTLTVEENAARMGITYVPLTLQEVRRLKAGH
ncbi:DUF6624 domain-containing protein [Flaviaesturariibacter aridisoli]|uniref:DUF4919 domain-containing protein n=1 Tax=Flaviaesturariibacter aridisoli TaxID=2545761 RepID=A0A4R4E7B5_9BACT|nr:DUF6624 domain-containing protein [Flaviaesturariibacter aridisoli]TCZ73628.1 hypothetical protein E0486_04925 [Flaviaesturariibacter aridisoli]